MSPLTFLYAFLLQLNVTPLKYKERRPWPSEAQVRPTPLDAGRKVLKPKRLLQTPAGAPLVAPDPESIGTIPRQLVQVSKEEVVDNIHIGDVAKYSFYDQVTLQAKVKEDSGAVTWAEPVMVRFPMWMKGHVVGRDPPADFLGGTLYQIEGDSHSYVQTWRVHGGQLKQAKRVQWLGVAGYLPITDAAVVAEVDGAMERWKFLLAGKVGGKRETETGGGGGEGYDTDQSRHGSRLSRAKKPKLGAEGGPVLPPKLPPASPSAPLREHLKDTQQQLKARIEELEKVRKQSAQAQKAAEDMLREERVKWEEERREKDAEIRDLRVKLQDASVRGGWHWMPGMGSFFAVVLCTYQHRGLVNATHWCLLPRSASARCRGRTWCCCGVLGSGCLRGSMCNGCSVRQHARVVERARTRWGAWCVCVTVLHRTRCCVGAYALGS